MANIKIFNFNIAINILSCLTSLQLTNLFFVDKFYKRFDVFNIKIFFNMYV